MNSITFRIENFTESHTPSGKLITWEYLSYYTFWGKCFMARKMGPINDSFFHVSVHSKREYDIWFLDPNNFVLSYNPDSTPSLWKSRVKVIYVTFFRNLWK